MLFQNHNNLKRQSGIFVHPLKRCVSNVKPDFYEPATLFINLNVHRCCFSISLGLLACLWEKLKIYRLAPPTLGMRGTNRFCILLMICLFLFKLPLAAQQSLSTAISAIDSVSVHQQKEHFESATIQYLSALSNGPHTQTDLELLDEEITLFTLLLTQDQADQLESLREESPQEAGQAIVRLWKSMDPTPVTNVNERLIEHRIRIHKARVNYFDPESSHGLDDRGLIYIKYGEPDQVLDRPFNINRGEIYEFVLDFYLNLYGGANVAMIASDITDNIIDSIYKVPFSTHLNIWIYNRLNTSQDNNLTFYFSEQKNDVFKQVKSIDDGYPIALYRPPRNLPFSPALPLQYITYQRLMHEDQIFMDTFNRLDFEIFESILPRSPYEWGVLANNFKANTNQLETRRQLQAPPENSSLEDLIPDIEINIHQYRSFNAQLQPILITFFESRPTAAFLQDLTLNNEPMMADSEDRDQILSLISQWYSLQQGIELYDVRQNQVGRIRDRPILQLEGDTRQPTITIADLPFIGEEASQVFYSKLLNNHPETVPSQPSLFPDELRGMGRAVVLQGEHLQTEEQGELLMSDLIFGYNRIEHDEVRFPFIIKHDHILPENENPVIHFELFGLERDPTGFAHFEIGYQFEPKRGFLSFLRQTSDLLSGTLEFTTSASHFRESLEFDNLPLSKGSYSLTWFVKDLIGGSELTRELEFKVEESDQFTITSN